MINKKPEDVLKEAREKKHLTQLEIAEKLGISSRQYQNYEEGKFPKFKRDAVKNIDQLLGTNIYAIIYEENVPRAPYGQDARLATHELNEPEDPINLSTQLPNGNSFIVHRRELKNNKGPYTVPLVPVAAQAGYAKNFYDMAYIEKLDTYPILPGVDPHGASWRYFQVQGESMEPTLKPDQFILTSQVIKEDWRNVEHTYIYVIITGEGVIVKRLYKVKGKEYWAAVSDNSDEHKYPQFRIYVKDVQELWKFRRKVDWDAPAPRKVEIKV